MVTGRLNEQPKLNTVHRLGKNLRTCSWDSSINGSIDSDRTLMASVRNDGGEARFQHFLHISDD